MYPPFLFLQNTSSLTSFLISWSFEDISINREEKSLPKTSKWQFVAHWNFIRRSTGHVHFPSVLLRCMIDLPTPTVMMLFALWIKIQERRKMYTFHLGLNDLMLAKSCAIFAFSRFHILSLLFGATVCLVNNLTVFCC